VAWLRGGAGGGGGWWWVVDGSSSIVGTSRCVVEFYKRTFAI
jgi:hypothetical protein